ncbi:hypothetical protein evm_001317 [Chilo suppressalis]|nr:hypothetical protein evm_001317 [Chilo suppressalis]
MSFMLLAALLIAPLIFGDAALVTNGYTKSKDFVDVLKQDLRRNNDDYLDAMQHKTSSTNSNKNFIELGRSDLKTLPAPTMNRLNFRGDDKRRALNELE